MALFSTQLLAFMVFNPTQTVFPSQPSSQAALAQQVCGLIHQRKNIPLRQLHVATHLHRELGFDMVDLVDIILEVERRFQLTIPDEVPLHTVGDFVCFLEMHVEAGRGNEG
jgi:acyl carrier protein